MKVGVLHPTINKCGGAELVAINVLSCIKKMGHETVLMANEKLDRPRVENFFGRKALVDAEIVFPLELFQSTNPHNIYTDFVRALILKSKCDLLVDTYSNATLPGSNIAYIHYPLSGRIPGAELSKNTVKRLKNFYYLPYSLYEKSKVKRNKIVLFANSEYTKDAIEKFMKTESTLLYPPISSDFFIRGNSINRTDTVVSVGRISPEKYFTLIPQIAKLTEKNIQFVIVGIRSSEAEFKRVREFIIKCNVADRVKIVDNASRKEIIAILQSSKILLHTAIGEHFGMSIAEGMASGCVPITHDSGGPKEFVPNQFRFDGVENAAEIINKEINDWSPKTSYDFSLFAERFSEENFSKMFMEIFCSYLEKIES